jgi:Lon protease-like protein
LPLFPLGTVLFPGLLLPLHVFEPRYRAMVRDLLALPDGVAREFGVVAIRRGWEVERGLPGNAGELTANERPVLYDVGCAAEVRRVDEQPDGRINLVTVGRRRFRVLRLDGGPTPYLTAEVEWLPEATGGADLAEALAASVLSAFRRYLRLLRADGDADEIGEQLPSDPTVLSHLVAATASLSVDDRQQLLAAADTVSRLRAERVLLRRETALLARIRAVPVPLTELAAPTGPN